MQWPPWGRQDNWSLEAAILWPGSTDAKHWCAKCRVCAARKTVAPHTRAPLHTVQAGFPMQTVAVDILGPLPDSPAGNRYILVAMDYFTRWAEAYPIPNQEAATVAPKLVNEMFLRFSHMQTEHHHQKELYDKRVHGRPFQPGDLVWLHNSHVPPGQSKKLHVPWSGPHKVVKRLSECTYQIQGSQLHVVHFPSHTKTLPFSYPF